MKYKHFCIIKEFDDRLYAEDFDYYANELGFLLVDSVARDGTIYYTFRREMTGED